MQVGVIVADADGYITYLNQTYARFLEVDPVEAVGKHSNQVIKNSRLFAVAKSGVAEINHPHQYKDIGFLVHRIPIKQNGKVTAVLGMVLFDRASTLSKLASQLSDMETMVNAYEQELISLRSTRYTIESIMGNSRAITGLKRHAYKAAATDLPVLITGESGTGKELFAQGIHHASRRRLYPFVRINCSAIPRDLLESELFGYEKGAFTGARAKGKPGKFELAGHGTVFLDEIGDLPMEMQPKLLRVLEEKEYERVGGTKLKRAEFRLLAATNRNLEQMLSEGRFREDLFYRLNVIPLRIPPLRQRPNDILPLAYHLLKQITLDSYRVRIAPQAEAVLENYHCTSHYLTWHSTGSDFTLPGRCQGLNPSRALRRP
jgi:transcriptional regulator with PAS, ATPase and Fis domain